MVFAAEKYTVKKGDNLCTIGAKTKVDWKYIAKINNIKSPYVIRSGQVLKLKADGTKKLAKTNVKIQSKGKTDLKSKTKVKAKTGTKPQVKSQVKLQTNSKFK
ncbi:LysM peptidoglycan-binding domain-containing protein [Clostridium tetanomorphum]|uniref:LysM peptidoglycan-binding domain-containing protein n=2 Tax=Clostridium tetanomorphum TaxID=1553 RepID=A0A923E4L4_CLOTT|nr:LysM peptidoglycan-binding domain-containing protein [Clostridium tetanomorphum]MBC2396330.1 LysM peptidoglycan-binding domain-containing protein [Clostridium tetanomorphum]